MIRVGQGYDVHRFNDGDHIILGGVTIPYEKGLEAHSDGDVVLHALADAILGAAALGDIGKHFPDTDPEFKGADSRVLLRHVYKIVQEKGYKLINADVTIIAQAPKMLPHVPAMRANIAADLEVDVDFINVKATTTEKLGFEGRKEGIAVQAVVLIEKSNDVSQM
jgi:2-C-methyl-D-erythritol 2,4-cyclodiphosphate synthase